MNEKDVLKSAFQSYKIVIQMTDHYEEAKCLSADRCLDYIENQGSVGLDWLRSHSVIIEALKEYQKQLKDELITEESLLDEYRVVNRLILKIEGC